MSELPKTKEAIRRYREVESAEKQYTDPMEWFETLTAADWAITLAMAEETASYNRPGAVEEKTRGIANTYRTPCPSQWIVELVEGMPI